MPTVNRIMGLLPQKGKTHDLPQLPHKMPKVRERPEG